MAFMLIKHRGSEPAVHPSAYLAPTATLVGDVRVGPRARVMYGAVLDAEAAHIDVGECSIICENAVLRGGSRTQPVVLGDHVFVGPHTTLLGCTVGRCAYLAAGTTVLQEASLQPGTVVAVGALVHARSAPPAEFFVPPNTIFAGGQVYTPGDPDLPAAIRSVGFAKVAFGVDADWEDRIVRYERSAEVRSAQFGDHADDEIIALRRPSLGTRKVAQPLRRPWKSAPVRWPRAWPPDEACGGSEVRASSSALDRDLVSATGDC
jgi:carbonic anhydrase/acetyltransferase-like protein (isoleucine patch superfamily)